MVGVGEGEGGREGDDGGGGWGCLIGAGVPVTVGLVKGKAEIGSSGLVGTVSVFVWEKCALLSLLVCECGVPRAVGPSQEGCRLLMGGAGGGA